MSSPTTPPKEFFEEMSKLEQEEYGGEFLDLVGYSLNFHNKVLVMGVYVGDPSSSDPHCVISPALKYADRRMGIATLRYVRELLSDLIEEWEKG